MKKNQKQKKALLNLLTEFDKSIERELSPKKLGFKPIDKEISEKLLKGVLSYRNCQDQIFDNFYRTRFDYVFRNRKLIIEYDEKQHFSEPRALTFSLYPEIFLHFDKEIYKKLCEDTKNTTGSGKTPFRLEQRAYYDSLKDLTAAKNGYILIRLIWKDYDFTVQEDKEQLYNLLKQKSCL